MKIKLEKKIDLFALIRAIIYVISIILVVLVQIGIIKTSCFWYDNYGILCPSCGLTRATKSIIQLTENGYCPHCCDVILKYAANNLWKD